MTATSAVLGYIPELSESPMDFVLILAQIGQSVGLEKRWRSARGYAFMSLKYQPSSERRDHQRSARAASKKTSVFGLRLATNLRLKIPHHQNLALGLTNITA